MPLAATSFLVVWLAGMGGGMLPKDAVGKMAGPASRPVVYRVTFVRGLAQYRLSDGDAWKALKGELELKGDAEIRTGPRTEVLIRREGDSDRARSYSRLGSTTVERAAAEAGPIQKFPWRHLIEDGDRSPTTEPTIRSPGATLGIRGQRAVLIDRATTRPAGELKE